MIDLFLIKRALQRRLPKRYQARLQEVIYFFLYNYSPARHQNFFNSGFFPASEFVERESPFDKEPLQAELYNQVAWEYARDIVVPNAEILDIGSGLGGGIMLTARRYAPARIVGVDADKTAVKVARRRLEGYVNASLLHGDGKELPFEDAQFDAIFSVGAAGYIGVDAFMSEASRVLKPGGVLSFSAGYTDAKFARYDRKIRDLSKRLKLEVHQLIDITDNVYRAIAADAPRRQLLIDRVPWPFRGYAANWADMPGSMRYQEYVDGRRLDFLVVCRKV